MVALTRVLGALVGWVLASPRRLLATVAVPVFVALVLAGPSRAVIGHSSTDRPDQAGAPSDAASPGPAGTPPGNGGAPAGGPTPATVTIGPSDRPRPQPTLPPAASAVAVNYVRTVDSHDARPGRDRGFLDSYVRAKPYVTAALYRSITAPRQTGDYQWTAWTRQRATVTVSVDNAALPDGAPLPTPSTVYVRVHFTQTATPHVPGAAASTDRGDVTVVTERQHDGRWLVSRLVVA